MGQARSSREFLGKTLFPDIKIYIPIANITLSSFLSALNIGIKQVIRAANFNRKVKNRCYSHVEKIRVLSDTVKKLTEHQLSPPRDLLYEKKIRLSLYFQLDEFLTGIRL